MGPTAQLEERWFYVRQMEWVERAWCSNTGIFMPPNQSEEVPWPSSSPLPQVSVVASTARRASMELSRAEARGVCVTLLGRSPLV